MPSTVVAMNGESVFYRREKKRVQGKGRRQTLIFVAPPLERIRRMCTVIGQRRGETWRMITDIHRIIRYTG